MSQVSQQTDREGIFSGGSQLLLKLAGWPLMMVCGVAGIVMAAVLGEVFQFDTKKQLPLGIALGAGFYAFLRKALYQMAGEEEPPWW